MKFLHNVTIIKLNMESHATPWSLFNTKILCYVCLKPPETLEESVGLNSILSLRSLFHYLDIKQAWENSMDCGKKSIFFCQACSKLLLKFQELFHLWQEIVMKLGLCLEEIGAQLEIKECIDDTVFTLPKRNKERKLIKQKCKNNFRSVRNNCPIIMAS